MADPKKAAAVKKLAGKPGTPGSKSGPAKKEYVPSKEFLFVCEKMAPVFAEIAPYLREFQDNEERIRYLTNAMVPIEKEFFGLITSSRKTEGDLSMEGAIRLWGGKNTYDFLIAYHFLNAVPGYKFKWDDKSGRPLVAVGDIVKHAAMARDAFGEDSRYAYPAFITGLVFDVLYLLNAKEGQNIKKTEELIKGQFEEALKVAKAGLEAGKKAKGLVLERFIISAVLLKRTGRIIFAMLNPEYMDFAKGIAENGFRSRFAHLAEKIRYSNSNNMISCLLCKFVPELQQIAPALLFYDYPFMLNDNLTAPDLYQLVSLCVNLQPADAD